jgi:hypothetical protein
MAARSTRGSAPEHLRSNVRTFHSRGIVHTNSGHGKVDSTSECLALLCSSRVRSPRRCAGSQALLSVAARVVRADTDGQITL